MCSYNEKSRSFIASINEDIIFKSVFGRDTNTHISMLLIYTSFSGLHSRFGYKELDDGFLLSDINELHFLELPKFKGEAIEGLVTSLDRWLHVL